ncbi:DUF4255 domain-containing protein [Photorhabdus laumondii subsp. laumondii]|uniref:Photorhabdus luminescens subsp. laumondii TTO1 complete genome segment 9/17 n=2 Tax=Photorhabdus laumondii subsp. laumondii TaxID=141679 RepID=Q7N438_PHOLL|nr:MULTISPECIES: DUF4255 domain-containing protein [Photorhabdus]AWK42263.1 hypothetical protein A4R40_12530 [Photorhabdus laumondii subsp. laumondii]AXG43112.1 DUF4255 domain-containing protein [Photorhabdus laumondii subsp. laumondii]AXG47583.1 DUF4255 domain-containing protein [Photorhabdus laumondii subsp. laumondii]KTL62880.1 hypothetical protein AA106_04985 [Photorhabdus laumondii subsp. laumondii]MCC8385000.1 DUF4255 domain-containing protein [Photorhabdus laumondii]
MKDTIEPNNAIVEVNNALKDILSRYLNNIDIRFDLPDIDSIPSKPTISVFLYDVHEDLQLRSAEPKRYNPVTNLLLPGWVNINYNYLITYWHSNKPSVDGSSPDSQPDNQAAKIMTSILNALINHRQLPKIPGAYTKVIPPQENLNSLGNFWQALGNRPRLSLLYSITAPVKLQDITNIVEPVMDISHSVDQKLYLTSSQICQELLEKLCVDLGGTEDIRLALTKVNLTIEPLVPATGNNENEKIILEASGITFSTYYSKIKEILSTWVNSRKAVVKINGIGIIVDKVDFNKLISIEK